MFNLVFTKAYEEVLFCLDFQSRIQISKKVEQLKLRPFLGKRLIGYPYWSLHIGDRRIIYKLDNHSQSIIIITILERKHDYKELGNL